MKESRKEKIIKLSFTIELEFKVLSAIVADKTLNNLLFEVQMYRRNQGAVVSRVNSLFT